MTASEYFVLVVGPAQCDIDDCRNEPTHHIEGYPDDVDLCDEHVYLERDYDAGGNYRWDVETR